MSTTVSAEYLAESRAGVVRGVVWTSAVLPLIFVSLRCYVRIGLRKTFGLDDAFAIMATVRLILPSPDQHQLTFSTLGVLDRVRSGLHSSQ